MWQEQDRGTCWMLIDCHCLAWSLRMTERYIRNYWALTLIIPYSFCRVLFFVRQTKVPKCPWPKQAYQPLSQSLRLIFAVTPPATEEPNLFSAHDENRQKSSSCLVRARFFRLLCCHLDAAGSDKYTHWSAASGSLADLARALPFAINPH